MATFKCTRCGGEHFYQKAQGVYCHKCNGLYSAPGLGELNLMIKEGVFDEPEKQVKPPDSIMAHYYKMKSFKEFCR